MGINNNVGIDTQPLTSTTNNPFVRRIKEAISALVMSSEMAYLFSLQYLKLYELKILTRKCK